MKSQTNTINEVHSQLYEQMPSAYMELAVEVSNLLGEKLWGNLRGILIEEVEHEFGGE